MKHKTKSRLLDAARIQLERNPRGTVPALAYAIAAIDRLELEVDLYTQEQKALEKELQSMKIENNAAYKQGYLRGKAAATEQGESDE